MFCDELTPQYAKHEQVKVINIEELIFGMYLKVRPSFQV